MCKLLVYLTYSMGWKHFHGLFWWRCLQAICICSSCVLHAWARTHYPAQQTSLVNGVSGNWILQRVGAQAPHSFSPRNTTTMAIKVFFQFKINLVSVFWDSKPVCVHKIWEKTQTLPFLPYYCEIEICFKITVFSVVGPSVPFFCINN